MRVRGLRCGYGLYICRKQSNFNASASFFSDLHQPFPFLRIDNSMVKKRCPKWRDLLKETLLLENMRLGIKRAVEQHTAVNVELKD